MSGGIWERTPTYIPNGNGNLVQGSSFTNYSSSNTVNYTKTSYKYYTIYPYLSSEYTENSNAGTASQANYEYAKGLNGSTITRPIYGDGVLETSTQGINNNSWYGDYSDFPSLVYPFVYRGGYWNHGLYAGLFSFFRGDGGPNSYYGFRAVLV